MAVITHLHNVFNNTAFLDSLLIFDSVLRALSIQKNSTLIRY